MDFFVNKIILPMLSYFQLLYDYFPLFKLFHPTLFMDILNYLWLFLAISL